MKIQITNLQKRVKIKSGPLKRIIAKIAALTVTPSCGTLSFVFTDNAGIIPINKEFFGKSRATDVIAFKLNDSIDPLDLYGEIFISIEQTQLNSKTYHTHLSREILRYITHGLLHLNGYNDKTCLAKKKMKAQEDKILKNIFTDQKDLIKKSFSLTPF